MAARKLTQADALMAARKLTQADALDFERRWLAECRAHGETKRKLAAAHHELGDHSLCDPRDCEGDRD